MSLDSPENNDSLMPKYPTQSDIRKYLDENPSAQILLLDIDNTVLREVEPDVFEVINEEALIRALKGNVIFFVTDSPSSKIDAEKKLKVIRALVEKHNLICDLNPPSSIGIRNKADTQGCRALYQMYFDHLGNALMNTLMKERLEGKEFLEAMQQAMHASLTVDHPDAKLNAKYHYEFNDNVLSATLSSNDFSDKYTFSIPGSRESFFQNLYQQINLPQFIADLKAQNVENIIIDYFKNREEEIKKLESEISQLQLDIKADKEKIIPDELLTQLLQGPSKEDVEKLNKLLPMKEAIEKKEKLLASKQKELNARRDALEFKDKDNDITRLKEEISQMEKIKIELDEKAKKIKSEIGTKIQTEGPAAEDIKKLDELKKEIDAQQARINDKQEILKRKIESLEKIKEFYALFKKNEPISIENLNDIQKIWPFLDKNDQKKIWGLASSIISANLGAQQIECKIDSQHGSNQSSINISMDFKTIQSALKGLHFPYIFQYCNRLPLNSTEQGKNNGFGIGNFRFFDDDMSFIRNAQQFNVDGTHVVAIDRKLRKDDKKYEEHIDKKFEELLEYLENIDKPSENAAEKNEKSIIF